MWSPTARATVRNCQDNKMIMIHDWESGHVRVVALTRLDARALSRRFCANDPASLYLGQSMDLRDKHGLPSGFASVRACLLEDR